MTQFKEKSHGQDSVRLGLLTYPALMAADILLHGAREVPVGDDQRQHVELARALAKRFNSAYGDVFVVPEAVVPPTAARVMDLSAPQRKMAKSTETSAGIVFVLDPPDLIRRKINRAVTDDSGTVEYRPERQPGVTNLLEILGAATDTDPRTITVASYAALKSATVDAVVALLDPVRKNTEDLLADPAELARMRSRAAESARSAAQDRLAAAKRMAGIG
jgi:tryptophanyl-tRNA synthetase